MKAFRCLLVSIFLAFSAVVFSGCQTSVAPAVTEAATSSPAPTKSYHDPDILITFEYPENWDFEKTYYNGNPLLDIYSPDNSISLHIQTNNRQDGEALFDGLSDDDIKDGAVNFWNSYSKKLVGHYDFKGGVSFSTNMIGSRKFAFIQAKGVELALNKDCSYNMNIGVYGTKRYTFDTIVNADSTDNDTAALAAILQSVRFDEKYSS
jgi:hypothetical protein